MDFIGAANRGGYRPTVREVEEWRTTPDQKPGKPGKLIKAAVPPQEGSFQAMLAAQGLIGNGLKARLVLSSLLPLLGGGGSPAQYGPPGLPERFMRHLRRLGWVEKDKNGRLSLTLLGRALMRSDDQAEVDDDAAMTVVLRADDPLAYGKLIAHIAETEDALVIDPYLRAEDLLEILSHTTARRFLIGSSQRSSIVAELTVLMQTLDVSDEPAELRQAEKGVLHDRYVVGADRVAMIGGSINNVGGSTTTVIVPIEGNIADDIRQYAEGWWDNAILLATTVTGEPEDLDDHEEGHKEMPEPV